MINYFSALGTEAIFGILKQSNNPTVICIGRDLNIQFVNDAVLNMGQR
ncbi:hypothetical protein PQ459_14120 [Chryseobacterium sp. KACC 21268]|nr:hypothetical protein PQ459_14120 [Chryseobacterium sp. KACC 21268]